MAKQNENPFEPPQQAANGKPVASVPYWRSPHVKAMNLSLLYVLVAVLLITLITYWTSFSPTEDLPGRSATYDVEHKVVFNLPAAITIVVLLFLIPNLSAYLAMKFWARSSKS